MRDTWLVFTQFMALNVNQSLVAEIEQCGMLIFFKDIFFKSQKVKYEFVMNAIRKRV